MKRRRGENIDGQVFGKLTVVKETTHRRYYKDGILTATVRRFICRCDCGKEVERSFPDLMKSKSTHCGCARQPLIHRQIVAVPKGYLQNCDRTHDLYLVWQNMIQRCYNPKNTRFSDYGGRGITVCDRWLESGGVGLSNFIQDMGNRPDKNHHLDREDVESGYSKENCRWINKKLSAYNTRKQKNNTSGTTGVYREEGSGKWKAIIMQNGRLKNLGRFKVFEDAVAARKAAEIMIYGEHKNEHK